MLIDFTQSYENTSYAETLNTGPGADRIAPEHRAWVTATL